MIYDELPIGTRKWFNAILFATILLVFGVSLAFAFLAVPCHDDFCRATLDVDWWEYVRQTYFKWSGRWAVHILYGVTFPRINITSINYNFLLAACLPLWIITFYILVDVCFGAAMSRRAKLGFASILCAVYWTGAPQIEETWYWLTGDAEYNIPFFLFALLIYVLAQLLRRSRSPQARSGLTIFACCLAFLIGGFNELVSMLLIPAIATAVWGLAEQQRRSDAVIVAAVLVFGGVGFAVNALAPGTAGHARSFTHPYSFSLAVEAASFRAWNGSFPIDWLLDTRLLLLSVLLLTNRSFIKVEPTWTRYQLFGGHALLLLPIIGMMTILATWFCVAFAQGGGTLAGRVLNILYAFFMFVWLATLLVASGRVRGHLEQWNTLLRAINIWACILFPLSLLTSPRMVMSAHELRYVVVPWRQAIAHDLSPANSSRFG